GDHFARGLHARQVHMKVVKVEEDDAAAIEGHRTFQIDCRGAARRCELTLFATAGGDLFEGLNLTRLAVDAQFEIVSREAIDKVTLLVENHHVGLDEFGVNAYNVVRWFLGWRSWGRLRGLRTGGRTSDE